MKRTINDIYELLKQKQENANNDLTAEYMKQNPNYNRIVKLECVIAAYHDVIILIETSDVLNKVENTSPNQLK